MSNSSALYLDTNVIVARYKPNDPLHKVSEKLLSNKDFEFFISPVTLFELYAVISRLLPHLFLPPEVRHVSVSTIVHFIMEDCNLKFTSKTYLTTIYFRDQRIRTPFEYSMAMILAERLKLRALDLLHISYASILRDKAQLFVTGDDEFLKRRKAIKEFTGLKVMHPKDLYD